MPKRACLILNPTSGLGTSEHDINKITELLTSQFDLDIKRVEGQVSITSLVQDALSDAVDTMIVAGGDGTVSAVGAELVGHDVALGIIPRGTANAFAKALNIPSKLEEACAVVTDYSVRTVDMVRHDDGHMILLAGFGLEAEVIRHAEADAKKRFGPLAYIMSSVRQLKALTSFEAELELDGDRTIQVTASAITVANVAPATSILAHGPAGVIPDDGLLDITIVTTDGILDTLAASVDLFRSALQGEAATQQSIGYFRTRAIKVTTTPSQAITIDGEVIQNMPIQFECIPQALKVYVPRLTVTPPIAVHNTVRLPQIPKSSPAWLAA